MDENIPCWYSMYAIWTFDGMENKYDVYRGEDYVKKFCKFLREHAVKIIKFEKTKMILLTSKEYESYLNQTSCQICKKKFGDKYITSQNYHKLRTIVILQVNTEVLHIEYVI